MILHERDVRDNHGRVVVVVVRNVRLHIKAAQEDVLGGVAIVAGQVEIGPEAWALCMRMHGGGGENASGYNNKHRV